jgi:hypothetical protein
MSEGPSNAPNGFPGGFPNGFPGGFRVFSAGRDAASRFRVKPPWRARVGANAFERAVIGIITFVLAVPVALLLLALGLVLLVAFFGCAIVFIAFGLAMFLVRKITGSSRGTVTPLEDDGRENVRVRARQEPRE